MVHYQTQENKNEAKREKVKSYLMGMGECDGAMDGREVTGREKREKG